MLLLVLLGAWLALPTLVVVLARRHLPLRFDPSLSVTDVYTTPTSLPSLAQARLMVAASPARIRSVAASLGQPLPAMVVREGLCTRALWHDLSQAGELPIELVAVVRRAADPPLVMLAVPAEPLAALIARTAEPLVIAGSRLDWQYRLDPGTVLAHEGPPQATANGFRRRFRAEAAGWVTARFDEGLCEVRVTRLEGYIDLDLDRRADGWHLHGKADIEQLESRIERCTSPLLQTMSGNLEGLLELLLNTQVLSEQARREDVLPLWFPIDLGLQGVVVAEPGDCAAAAMLPLR